MSVQTQVIGHDVLALFHYNSIEEAGQEMLYLSACEKLSTYRDEDRRFEVKYGVAFDVFRKQVDSKQEEEDFAEEDDLMAWRYAHEAARFWAQKVADLQPC